MKLIRAFLLAFLCACMISMTHAQVSTASVPSVTPAADASQVATASITTTDAPASPAESAAPIPAPVPVPAPAQLEPQVKAPVAEAAKEVEVVAPASPSVEVSPVIDVTPSTSDQSTQTDSSDSTNTPAQAEVDPLVVQISSSDADPDADAARAALKAQIGESIQNLFSSLFSPPSQELNDSPRITSDSPGAVTKEYQIPGGMMIVSQYESDGNDDTQVQLQTKLFNTKYQLQAQSETVEEPSSTSETETDDNNKEDAPQEEVDPTAGTVEAEEVNGAGVPDENESIGSQESDSDAPADADDFDSPPPPPPFFHRSPLSRFFDRVFGRAPPPPFLNRGMFDGEDEGFPLRRQHHIRMDEQDQESAPHHHMGGRGGCRKHLGLMHRMPLIARLRSLFNHHDEQPSMDPFFPPPPPSMFSGDLDAEPSHGFHSFGPFFRVRFNLGGEGENPIDPASPPSNPEDNPEDSQSPPPFMVDPPSFSENNAVVNTESEPSAESPAPPQSQQAPPMMPPMRGGMHGHPRGPPPPPPADGFMMGPMDGTIDPVDPSQPSGRADDPVFPPPNGGHHHRIAGFFRHHPLVGALICAAILLMCIGTCVCCYRRRKARRQEEQRRNQAQLNLQSPPLAFSQQPHTPATNPYGYAQLGNGPSGVEFAAPVQAYAY